MYTFDTFTKAIEQLDKRVKEHYRPYIDKQCRQIITDGIVNNDEYFDADPKILWILKEPYDLDNDGTETWSLSGLLNDSKKLHTAGGVKTTWYPIIYIMYSVFNEFPLWDDMENIEKDDSMIDALKKMAIMNVQKFPADTSTDNADISEAYRQHSQILLDQINVYKPDIIIGANTVKLFLKDLDVNVDERKYVEYDYWISNNKLYIDAEHPAGRFSKEDYVNDIVRIIKNFRQGTDCIKEVKS